MKQCIRVKISYNLWNKEKQVFEKVKGKGWWIDTTAESYAVVISDLGDALHLGFPDIEVVRSHWDKQRKDFVCGVSGYE